MCNVVSQGVPGPVKTTLGCHGDSCSKHYGMYSLPDVCGDSVLMTDGWPGVSLILDDVLFTAVSSLALSLLDIYISFFICLAPDLSFSAHPSVYWDNSNVFVLLLLELSLYQIINMSTFTLFLALFSFCPNFHLSGEASAAGGAGPSPERDGGWEAQTTAAQGLTHIHRMI